MTLAEVLIAAAATSPDVTTALDGNGASTWARDDVVFATLDGSGATASFRLDPVLSRAARRTPDTAESFLGPEWVEFRPAVLDGHAVDRATAWFGAAHRRAGDSPAG